MTPAADYDPEYIEFVRLFNERDYDTAHRTLTEAWIRNPSDTFYKGLIQLAGALEHWHDDSWFWAEDLLASAHNLLSTHAPVCEGLDVDELLETIRSCHAAVQQARSDEDADPDPLPAIHLTLSSD